MVPRPRRSSHADLPRLVLIYEGERSLPAPSLPAGEPEAGDAEQARYTTQTRYTQYAEKAPRKAEDHAWWGRSRVLEGLLLFVALPLFGALTANRLTSPASYGPTGMVRMAEAPPQEVAGARAGSVLPAPIESRLPPGVQEASEAPRVSQAMAGQGGVLETPDGVRISIPGSPAMASGRSGSSGAESRAGVASMQGASGVAGIADVARDEGVSEGASAGGTGVRGSVETQPASPASNEVTITYRPLELPSREAPSPRVLRAFDLSAVMPDGQLVGQFPAPLTVSVPVMGTTTGLKAAIAAGGGDAVTGWVTLAAYDAALGAWVELPGAALNRRAGTLSVQLRAPATLALLENRPPVTADDAVMTRAGIPVTLDVLANDTDPDGDPLGVFLEESAGMPSAQGGFVQCIREGECVYTPPPDFVGTDTFVYGAGDLRTYPNGVQTWSDNRASATVTVAVQPAG